MRKYIESILSVALYLITCAALPAMATDAVQAKATYRLISARELHNLTEENKRPITIIDVGNIEAWSRAHIPQATIADRTTGTGLPYSKMSLLAVYNGGFGSEAARDYAQRLIDAGYADVVVIPGGLAEWEGAHYPIEGISSSEKPPLPIKADAVKSALMFKDNFRLVDVRSRDTFVEQRIVGAFSATPNTVPAVAGDLGKTDWIVIYDANDHLADIAAFEMQRLGFKRVVFVDGGFPALIAADVPTERGKPTDDRMMPNPAPAAQTKPAKSKGATKGAQTRPSNSVNTKSQKKVPGEQSQ